jgi:hypothetical protein
MDQRFTQFLPLSTNAINQFDRLTHSSTKFQINFERPINKIYRLRLEKSKMNKLQKIGLFNPAPILLKITI